MTTFMQYNTKIFHVLLLCLITFCSNAVYAKKTLVHEAQYEGEYKSIDIVMKRKLWQLDEDTFLLETKAKNFLGSVVESEKFLWDKDNGIRPIAYNYQQKVFGVKRSRSVDFDWENNKAYSTDKDKKATVALKPGVLGPLSYQLKMQLDLIEHGALKEGDTLKYSFVNRNKLKEYSFALDSTQKQSSAKIPLKRTNESKTKTTRIWFNPSDNFTLVKLEQIKKNKSHVVSFQKGHYTHPLKGTPYWLAATSANEKSKVN